MDPYTVRFKLKPREGTPEVDDLAKLIQDQTTGVLHSLEITPIGIGCFFVYFKSDSHVVIEKLHARLIEDYICNEHTISEGPLPDIVS